MARVLDTSGIPTILPDARPASDYQNINADPSDFGGLIGGAEQRAGSEIGAGANELFQAAVKKQELYNETAGNQLYTKFQNSVNNLMYGDPNVPGDRGYFGLTGQAAMEQRPVVQKQIEAAIQQNADSAPSDYVRNRFNDISRRLQSYTYAQMGAHYEKESNVWAASSFAGATLENQRSVANNYNDEEFFKHTLADQSASVSPQAAQVTGVNPVARVAEDTSKLIAARIDGALAQNDYASAGQIFKQWGDKLDPVTQAAVATHLRAKSTDALGTQIFNDARSGVTPSGTGMPSAPLAPEVYKPLIDKAAQQYGVPPELLTRVLSAENGFKPTGFSSAGAQGIAQFMPETAQRYGINPNDPNQAIPGAAHYLADLKAEKGTWHGALTGYLGGDPKNDVSYTRAGAWQLADHLDGGGGMAPVSGAVGAPPEVWGDSLGVGLNNVVKSPGTVHGGDDPATIFNNIAAAEDKTPGYFQGKNVVLSSGTNGNDMQTVRQTISYLKNHGANVAVVGYGSKYAGRDQELQQIAKDTGAAYVAAGANDGTHMSPAGYRDAAQRAQSALPQPSSAGLDTGPTAPQVPGAQLVSTNAAPPAPGVASPPPPAPGLQQLAQVDAETAQNFGQVISRLESDPRRTSDPEAWQKAMQQAHTDYQMRHTALAGQMQAITVARAAAADDLGQKIIANPTDASLVDQITNNPSLDFETRKNLTTFHNQQIQGTLAGEAKQYGSKYHDIIGHIGSASDDPARIYDPTQLIAIAAQDALPDGTRALNDAGLTKALSLLKEAPTGIPKVQAGALAYARQKITGMSAGDDEIVKMAGIYSPKAEAKFLAFMPAFYNYWDDGIKAGKTPAQLVDSKALDPLIQQFTLSPAEVTQDRLLNGGNAAATSAPAIDLKSKDGIAAAFGAGHISRDEARKRLIEGGFFEAPTPPTPTPSAPVVH